MSPVMGDPMCPVCSSVELTGNYNDGNLFCTACGWDQLDKEGA